MADGAHESAFRNASDVVDAALGMVWCDVDMDGNDELVFTTWSAEDGGQLWMHTASIQHTIIQDGTQQNVAYPRIRELHGSNLASGAALTDQLPWMVDRIRGQRMVLTCLPGRLLNSSRPESMGRSLLVWWQLDPVSVVVNPILNDAAGCELQREGCIVAGGWRVGQLVPLLDAFEGMYTAPYSRTPWPRNTSSVPPVAAALVSHAVDYSEIGSLWVVQELSLCGVWNHTHYHAEGNSRGPRVLITACGSRPQQPCYLHEIMMSVKSSTPVFTIGAGMWLITPAVGRWDGHVFRMTAGRHGQATKSALACYSHVPLDVMYSDVSSTWKASTTSWSLNGTSHGILAFVGTLSRASFPYGIVRLVLEHTESNNNAVLSIQSASADSVLRSSDLSSAQYHVRNLGFQLTAMDDIDGDNIPELLGAFIQTDRTLSNHDPAYMSIVWGHISTHPFTVLPAMAAFLKPSAKGYESWLAQQTSDVFARAERMHRQAVFTWDSDRTALWMAQPVPAAFSPSGVSLVSKRVTSKPVGKPRPYVSSWGALLITLLNQHNYHLNCMSLLCILLRCGGAEVSDAVQDRSV